MEHVKKTQGIINKIEIYNSIKTFNYINLPELKTNLNWGINFFQFFVVCLYILSFPCLWSFFVLLGFSLLFAFPSDICIVCCYCYFNSSENYNVCVYVSMSVCILFILRKRVKKNGTIKYAFFFFKYLLWKVFCCWELTLIKNSLLES